MFPFQQSGPVIGNSYIQPGHYKVVNDPTPYPCPVCDVGYGASTRCSHLQEYHPDDIPVCQPCVHGYTYSSHVDKDQCRPCITRWPVPPGHVVARKCTASENGAFGCPSGWYDGEVHSRCLKRCVYMYFRSISQMHKYFGFTLFSHFHIPEND